MAAFIAIIRVILTFLLAAEGGSCSTGREQEGRGAGFSCEETDSGMNVRKRLIRDRTFY
jgi:hypothetical protein